MLLVLQENAALATQLDALQEDIQEAEDEKRCLYMYMYTCTYMYMYMYAYTCMS